MTTDTSSISSPQFVPVETSKLKSSARNSTLEGLRGFAALLVIVSHVYEMAVTGALIPPASNAAVGQAIEHLGGFGVYLFFMISGYLIIQSLSKHADVKRFLKNRAFRIYPCFAFLHIIMFTLGVWSGYEWMGSLRHSLSRYVIHFCSNLLFLPGIFDLPIAQKVAWSLSYEFAFYLLASLWFLAASLSRRRNSSGILLAAICAALIVSVVYYHASALFFLVGISIYTGRNYLMAIQGWRSLAFFGGITLALMFAFRANLLLSLLFGWLFFVTIVGETGWFSVVMRWRGLQYLGKISYSLYLIHPFALNLWRSVLHRLYAHAHSPGLSMLLFASGGFFFSVALASLMYRYIEVDFTRWISGKGKIREEIQAEMQSKNPEFIS